MPLALAWCTFCGIALYALFLFVQLLAPTPRAANVTGMVILFPLMMIGGSFFPFEAMPAWMARIGSFTPNGLGVLHLKDLLAGDQAPGTILAAAAGIGVPSAMAFTASLWRIRSRFARGVA